MTTRTERWLERGLLPDWLVRVGIRRLLRESIRRRIALTVVTALPPDIEESSFDAEMNIVPVDINS